MLVIVKIRNIPTYLIIVPFILYVAIIFVGTELADSLYVTSYYDSVAHFGRGLFVTVTGHSNPVIDHYYDMQPGFFWSTAIVSNVFGLSLTSFVDSMSMFIVKWMPLIAILVYTPVLFLFFKRLLKNNLLISIAFLLTFSLELLPFHYSAQTYGRVVYC